MGWLSNQKVAFKFQQFVTALNFLLGERQGEWTDLRSKSSFLIFCDITETPLNFLAVLPTLVSFFYTGHADCTNIPNLTQTFWISNAVSFF